MVFPPYLFSFPRICSTTYVFILTLTSPRPSENQSPHRTGVVDPTLPFVSQATCPGPFSHLSRRPLVHVHKPFRPQTLYERSAELSPPGSPPLLFTLLRLSATSGKTSTRVKFLLFYNSFLGAPVWTSHNTEVFFFPPLPSIFRKTRSLRFF